MMTRLSHDKQDDDDQRHRRDQEIVTTEIDQTGDRSDKGKDDRCMVLVFLPLVDDDDDE